MAPCIERSSKSYTAPQPHPTLRGGRRSPSSHCAARTSLGTCASVKKIYHSPETARDGRTEPYSSLECCIHSENERCFP